jgi:uncharacterized protein (DUF2062 family)
MKDFLRKRITQPIVRLLTQGITPEKIALSLAFGIVLGVFPVLGSTTLLCLLAAFVFQLNLPAIQLVNYLMYPAQLALLIPFIRAGRALFRAKPLGLSLSQMLAMSHADLGHAIRVLWSTALQAVAAWFLVGPIAIALLYWLLTPAIRKLRGTTRSAIVPSEAEPAAG